MKAWIKGAIVGGIWGLVGIFLGLSMLGSGGGGTTLQTWLRNFPDFIGYLVALPAFIVLYFLKIIQPSLFGGEAYSWPGLIIWPILIIFSPIIGALIGYGVTKIYLKLRK